MSPVYCGDVLIPMEVKEHDFTNVLGSPPWRYGCRNSKRVKVEHTCNVKHGVDIPDLL
jgi:hypothetical protein